jgi:hypothetical protein
MFLFSFWGLVGFIGSFSVEEVRAEASLSKEIEWKTTSPVPRVRARTVSVRPFPSTNPIAWDGHFSAKNFNQPKEKTDLSNLQTTLIQTLEKMPSSHVAALKDLEVRNQTHVSRGMANSKKIVIHSASIGQSSELVGVFVHELGHIFDFGVQRGENGVKSSFFDGEKPIFADDPSVQFYQLSWQDTKARRGESRRVDFVSGYAMSNPFEDFAEHYLFYRLHGEKFRAAMESSRVLQSKYAFFREKVFGGEEFQLDKSGRAFVHGVIWDATLVAHEGIAEQQNNGSTEQ